MSKHIKTVVYQTPESRDKVFGWKINWNQFNPILHESEEEAAKASRDYNKKKKKR